MKESTLMRSAGAILLATFVALGAFLLQQSGTEASFHCIRIHAVSTGFSGAPNAQYVELRMAIAGQNLLTGHKLRFYDSGGTLKATFTFPSGPATATAGDSILIGTKEFNDHTFGGDADFTFSDGSVGYPPANTVGSNGGDPLHPVQGTGGRVVWAFEGGPGDFNCNLNSSLPVDAVAYGGASGGFGSPAVALPNPATNSDQVLRLDNLNLKPSNNFTEYGNGALHTISTSTFTVADGNLISDSNTPRNNANKVLLLDPGVGGIAGQPQVAAAPQNAPDSSGTGAGIEAAIAAGAAAVVAGAIGAGVLVTKRRRLR